MPEQMIPAGRPDSPARRRSARPGKHPISLPLYLERDTEGKIGHPETELSVDRKLRHDIVACTDEDIGQETAVTGRLAVPPPTLLAHVRNLAAEGNARIGIEPLYELIMERSADTQQETVNLLPVRIVRIIVKTFAACGETHVAAHADGTVCVEQIVHDAVLSLYHYRRHDRITDIERRSRPYAGTEHDIAPPNVFCVCASAVMPATSKAANRMIPLFIPFISMILPSCLFRICLAANHRKVNT